MTIRNPAIVLFCLLVLGSLISSHAQAEVQLGKADGWEFFTEGRVNAFLSYTNGDGFPVPIHLDDTGMPVATGSDGNKYLYSVVGGGINPSSANVIGTGSKTQEQGRLESLRVRNGFLGNILALGVQRKLNQWVDLTGYIQMWSTIESEDRRKYLPSVPDIRQSYLKLEGPWGSLVAGRAPLLFSRGATTINFLYGHGYALGNAALAIDSTGPSFGHIGTGVLGAGFGAGFTYTSPSLFGLQLNVGIFDPVKLNGAYNRTKYPRPESEVTWETPLGEMGKLHLFVNGAYQDVYHEGEPDSTGSESYGAGYGARIEIGPVHLGLAGHYGQGLGLYYALETSDANFDNSPQRRLRTCDGFYGQLQLVLKSLNLDVNLGAGVSRIYRLPTDRLPLDPESPSIISLIQQQIGLSGVLVYHISEMLHVSADYFRVDFRWSEGERQAVNFVNSGVTMVW